MTSVMKIPMVITRDSTMWIYKGTTLGTFCSFSQHAPLGPSTPCCGTLEMGFVSSELLSFCSAPRLHAAGSVSEQSHCLGAGVQIPPLAYFHCPSQTAHTEPKQDVKINIQTNIYKIRSGKASRLAHNLDPASQRHLFRLAQRSRWFKGEEKVLNCQHQGPLSDTTITAVKTHTSWAQLHDGLQQLGCCKENSSKSWIWERVESSATA